MPESRSAGTISGRRRRLRARRLRLHPERRSRSDRLVILARLLHNALEHVARANALEERSANELQALKSRLLRASADLDNLRKRAAREKEEIKKTGVRNLIEALMPALDSFDHALAALEEAHDTEALASGVTAIHQQLGKGLRDHGLERIDPRGQLFDPNFHEGLAVEQTDEHPNNTVLQVYQCGYLLRGKLIRPARVRVSQRTAPETAGKEIPEPETQPSDRKAQTQKATN